MYYKKSNAQANHVGYVGNDPEIKNVGNTKLATFSLAVKRGSKDEDTTDWYNFDAWGHVADTIAKVVKKGARLLINSSMKINSWKDKHGQNRTDVVFNVKEIFVLDFAKDDSDMAPQPSDNEEKNKDSKKKK